MTHSLLDVDGWRLPSHVSPPLPPLPLNELRDAPPLSAEVSRRLNLIEQRMREAAYPEQVSGRRAW